jgi:hypothetical protein
MKYLKKYEKIKTINIIKNFAFYVIYNSKLKNYTEGFFDYSILDYTNSNSYYTYFFKFDLELFGDYEIGITKLTSFLESINAKNIKRKKYKDRIEISFDIERDIAKEKSELFMNINKYNI